MIRHAPATAPWTSMLLAAVITLTAACAGDDLDDVDDGAIDRSNGRPVTRSTCS